MDNDSYSIAVVHATGYTVIAFILISLFGGEQLAVDYIFGEKVVWANIIALSPLMMLAFVSLLDELNTGGNK